MTDRCPTCTKKHWACVCAPGKTPMPPQPQQMPKLPALAKLNSGRFIRLDHVVSAEWAPFDRDPAPKVLRVYFANNSGIHLDLRDADAEDVAALLGIMAGIAPAPQEPALVVPARELITP